MRLSLVLCMAREPLMLFSSCDMFMRGIQAKEKKLYFMNLKKEFDRVPRKVARDLRKFGVDESPICSYGILH